MPAKKNIHGLPADSKKWKVRKINFSQMAAKKKTFTAAEDPKSPENAKKKTFTADQARFEKLPLNKSLRRVRKKKTFTATQTAWDFSKMRKINFSHVPAKKIFTAPPSWGVRKKTSMAPPTRVCEKKTFTPGTGIAKMRKINFSHKTGIAVAEHFLNLCLPSCLWTPFYT